MVEMSVIHKPRTKYDFAPAIAFLIVALLCILPFTLDFMKYDSQPARLSEVNDVVNTIVLIAGIGVISLLAVLAATAARCGKSRPGKPAAFVTVTAALSFCGIIFTASVYPAAWSELIYLNSLVFHELSAGAYFVFLIPLVFFAAIIWSFSRAVKTFPDKLFDSGKIKDIETREFFSKLDQNISFSPGFSRMWGWIYLLLTLLSFTCLTFSYGVTYTEATHNLGINQRDVFYFLYKRDNQFLFVQACFVLLMLVNHTINRSALKTGTQNFARMLPFIRMLSTFVYTVFFVVNFPLICQLSGYYTAVETFAPTIAYYLHFIIPVLLLAALWTDTIFSSSKRKEFRTTESGAPQLPRALRIVHGAGYGLCSILAALALAFPFFVFQTADGENINLFLYGKPEQSYYPPFMPDGGVNTLTSINALVLTIIVISAFALIVFGYSRIIRRPLVNLSTLVPFLIKAVTALCYSILFALLISDMSGTRETFLTGTHSGGIFTRHLGWHFAFISIILLMLTLWTDVMLSAFILYRNRKIITKGIDERKVARLEARKDKISAKFQDAETAALSQRITELEAEIAAVRKRLAEREREKTEI